MQNPRATLTMYCMANQTKRHNPITSYSQSDRITNGAGDIMKFCVWFADWTVSSILPTIMLKPAFPVLTL